MKKFIAFIISINMILPLAGVVCFLQPAATAIEAEMPYLSLPDFLDEIEMDLNEYIAKMSELSEISEQWLYPYFLEKNSSRYEAYQQANPGIPYENVIAYVNVGLDFGPYSDIKDALDLAEVTVLINKTFAMPSTWTISDMVDIGTGHLMRAEAAEQMKLMMAAMTGDGLGRLYITSTHRFYQSQVTMFNNALNTWGREVAEKDWARPGHSEHHTGLSVDMLHKPYETNMQSARFQESDIYAWLIQEAHNYGFILRYPEAYQDIHGYIFEPWHWRYVGVDVACAMHEMEIVLYEDFYGRYITSDVLHKVREILLFELPFMIAAEEEERRLAAEEEERRLLAEEEERRLTEEEEERRLLAEEEERRLKAEEEERRRAAEEEWTPPVTNNATFILYLIPVVLIAAIIFTAKKINDSFIRDTRKDRLHEFLEKKK